MRCIRGMIFPRVSDPKVSNFSTYANQPPQFRANFLKPKPLPKRSQAHGGLDFTARTLAWVLADLRPPVPRSLDPSEKSRSLFSRRYRGKNQNFNHEENRERRWEIDVPSLRLDRTGSAAD